jgi:hypothetical protein
MPVPVRDKQCGDQKSAQDKERLNPKIPARNLIASVIQQDGDNRQGAQAIQPCQVGAVRSFLCAFAIVP